MRLTQEESRALAFIGGMILLSVLGRWVDRPRPLHGDLVEVNIDSLEAASRRLPAKRPPRPKPPKPKADVSKAYVSKADGSKADVSKADGSKASEAKTRRPKSTPEAPAQVTPRPARSSAVASESRAASESARRTGPAPPVVTRITPVGPPMPATQQPRVLNLNTATAAELEELPRVGPALAARIVEYRNRVGRFQNVDALTGVKGVGPAMLERLRPYLRAP